MTALRIAALLLLLAGGPARAANPPTLRLWPGTPPGEGSKLGPERLLDPQPAGRDVQRLTDVSLPEIFIYHPPSELACGAAVLIAPGGGYNILAWDLEGEEVARWLNSLGVTGIILKYRVPRRPGQPAGEPPPGPLQDAQRAISLVRSRAADLKIDPQRIGILGFSAGGHLAAAAATRFGTRSYPRIDEVDDVSSRPDFAVLIYPGYLADAAGLALRPEIVVDSKTPPMFLVHAHDDGVSPLNSALMYLALKRAGVPAELHVYSQGGHGYGLRPSEHPVSTWPGRCAAWMKTAGLLKRK